MAILHYAYCKRSDVNRNCIYTLSCSIQKSLTEEENFKEAYKHLEKHIDTPQKYFIFKVQKEPFCQGCLYNCLAQRDHMDCPNGCLHDPEFCGCLF